MKYTIILHKVSTRTLDEASMRKQLDHAISRITSGKRGRLWTAYRPRITHEEAQGSILYRASITLSRTGRMTAEDVMLSQVKRMEELAWISIRSRGWSLEAKTPDQVSAIDVPVVEPLTVSVQTEATIKTDKGDFFSHLYGVDAQIELVLSAVNEYQRSGFNNRFHAALYGAPACGKTAILRALTNMVGNDAVLHFDATSTTAAGARQVLIEAKHIPPILCIEEIEKADEQSLRWLLSVLDYRSEVRSVKFGSGVVAKDVKLLCLATVNDYALFNRMMDGALASRFSHKIHCPRPSREVLRAILQREVAKSNGNQDWIEPALEWCIDHEGTNDPRRITTVCLCGRDDLITGKYQEILAATMTPK